MVLFSPSELLVLWKTEQLFKTGSISSLPSALCSGVQSEFCQVTHECTLTRVRSGGWEGERAAGHCAGLFRAGTTRLASPCVALLCFTANGGFVPVFLTN